MKKPRIAIPVPTAHDLKYNRQSWPDYAAAVELGGGVAVELPLTSSLSANLALSRTCDGIVLPGSPADVDPKRYGQKAVEACAPADPAREELDLLLLEEAYATRKPLVAICFGCQMLNVWRGGTLLQDLAILPVNHAAGRAVAIAHNALVDSASCLGNVLDRNEALMVPEESKRSLFRLPINSSHHQAVGIAGEGLRVVARCLQDGVIEAVESVDTSRFLLGVQWHPERSVSLSPSSRNLFEWFIAASRSEQLAQTDSSHSAELPAASGAWERV